MKKHFLKKLTAVAAAALLCAQIFVLPAFAVVGDVNGSGQTKTDDARQVLRFALSLDPYDEQTAQKADVNSDGKVTSADARLILRCALKLESLTYYDSYYYETTADGTTMGLGQNGDELMFLIKNGASSMGLLLSDNGMRFIHEPSARYCELTMEDIDALNRIIDSLEPGSEHFDLEAIREEMATEMIRLKKPAALLDEGYVKSEGEWNGKTVDVYTQTADGKTETYYYDGINLLSIWQTENDRTTKLDFQNFTAEPQKVMHAHETTCQKVELLEMMDVLDDINQLL